MRVALATTDGKFVSRHFGHCPSFCVVEIDEATLEWRFVERREVAPACNQGEHSGHAFAGAIGALSDCRAVFVSKVGPQGRTELERRNIQVLERAGFVDELLGSYIKYLKRQTRFRFLRDGGDGGAAAGDIAAVVVGGEAEAGRGGVAGGGKSARSAAATAHIATAARDSAAAFASAAHEAAGDGSLRKETASGGAEPAAPGSMGFARQKGVGAQVAGEQAVGSQGVGGRAVGSRTIGSRTAGLHSGGSQATDSQAAGSRTARYRELANDHPCFSQGAHGRKGRLHLPVSGHCNIRCRFCERAFNSNEQRPGVSSGLLAPGKALEIVAKALELCPDIKVVGIAGPGDALASPAALDAFAEIHRAHPELIKCLSTNGLALPGKARALAAVGVRSATVTVNAVDPKIAGDIVSYIVYENKAYRGAEAGEILVRRQLAGIREAVREGIAVKINTVLIPPVNGRHIEDIARAVAAEGAHMHNIIPLIPQSEFARMAPPSCEEIENARAVAGEYMPQFRHCAHCRADACGVPGVSDFSGLLYAEGGLSRDTFSHG